MFGATSQRRRVTILLMVVLAVIAIGLARRAKKEIADPYVYDSLRSVTRGDTLSVGFRFEIDAPSFEYVRGNTGIIRDGNLLEFIVAEGLESSYQRLAGTLLGVRKTFSPQPTHLVLERIKRNGVVEADTTTLRRPARYTLPRLMNAAAIDQNVPGAPLPEIGFTAAEITDARSAFLPEKEGDALKTVKSAYANFAYRPRHDMAAGATASPADFAWYLIGDTSALEIVGLTEGAEWMLHLLKDKDLPVIGAFTLMTLEEEWTKRRVEYPGLGHVVGTARIDWFQYANAYVEGFGNRGR
jgi:hypothetical protein